MTILRVLVMVKFVALSLFYLRRAITYASTGKNRKLETTLIYVLLGAWEAIIGICYWIKYCPPFMESVARTVCYTNITVFVMVIIAGIVVIYDEITGFMRTVEDSDLWKMVRETVVSAALITIELYTTAMYRRLAV